MTSFAPLRVHVEAFACAPFGRDADARLIRRGLSPPLGGVAAP
ncbi:hypothetical protein [Xanthomonas bundabergensis]